MWVLELVLLKDFVLDVGEREMDKNLIGNMRGRDQMELGVTFLSVSIQK